ALENELGDRLLQSVRDAELTLQGVADETDELDVEGIVQAKALTQFLDIRDGRVLAQHAGDRIAHIAENHEGDEGDGQHDQHGLTEAPQDEGEHGVRLLASDTTPRGSLSLPRGVKSVPAYLSMTT